MLIVLDSRAKPCYISYHVKRLGKGPCPGKTPERGRACCKRFLPEPEQTPPWSRPLKGETWLGRDGTSRYRGHERRFFLSASRVEPWNTMSYLTPDFQGW